MQEAAQLQDGSVNVVPQSSSMSVVEEVELGVLMMRQEGGGWNGGGEDVLREIGGRSSCTGQGQMIRLLSEARLRVCTVVSTVSKVSTR